jgi:Ferritin-like
MIRLKRSLAEGLQQPTPQSVIDALQNAVVLEHATIPVYLYGLYSLDPARNADIVAILRSVVMEEMLHMTLASNVLNALGGSPVIDAPGFIPTYPGPLPGAVEDSLIVHLLPFSQDQLMTYLQIEQPENPISIPIPALGQNDPPPNNDGITIGEFYTAISNAIAALGDGAFVDPPRNQVGPDLMPGAIIVTDVASAQAAIATIIEQGEGSGTSPEEAAQSAEPAHYYRFMQIYAAAELRPAPGQTPPWSFDGPPILFDVGGVYPLPNDPSASDYAPGSAQAFANDNFNYTYTSLLKTLHGLFNGSNTQDRMNNAIALMMSLKGQAKAMMAGIPNPSAPNTGPSFEYQPVNPGN